MKPIDELVERLRFHGPAACEAADLIQAQASLICEAIGVLDALIDHADAMESQHSDYHELGETQPCRSRPLNEAIAFSAKLKGES